jgi:hypothetical protein
MWAAGHMVQYLSPLLGEVHAPHSYLESGKEEAMMCGCEWLCLFYIEKKPNGEQEIGQYSTYEILGIPGKLLSLQE